MIDLFLTHWRSYVDGRDSTWLGRLGWHSLNRSSLPWPTTILQHVLFLSGSTQVHQDHTQLYLEQWRVWSVVCQPKQLGGLGVTDMRRFSRALRLRRPCYQWTNPDRSWLAPCCLATSRTLTSPALPLPSTSAMGSGHPSSMLTGAGEDNSSSWCLSFSRLHLGRIKQWQRT
jgi:hypothetical protein